MGHAPVDNSILCSGSFPSLFSVLIVVLADSEGDAESTPLKPVQLLWINLIMDTFAAVALSTEPPYKGLLDFKPYDRKEPLMTPYSARLVILQVILQVATFLAVVYAGEDLFDSHGEKTVKGEGSFSREHLTVVFNVFVLSQLFNQFNCRKIRKTKNVFSRLHKHKLFLGVWIFSFLVQIMIVTFGGRAIKVEPLSITQWLRCILVGLFPLVWAFLFNLLPNSYVNAPLGVPAFVRRICCCCCKSVARKDEEVVEVEDIAATVTETTPLDQGTGTAGAADEEARRRKSSQLAVQRWQSASRRVSTQGRWQYLITKVMAQLDVVDAFRRRHR